jgi:hypothetical protein
VREPVVYEEPSERDRRRRERALALHEADGCQPASRAQGARVVLVVMLHTARAARRVRRGGVAACGCAPVFVKAYVKAR